MHGAVYAGIIEKIKGILLYYGNTVISRQAKGVKERHRKSVKRNITFSCGTVSQTASCKKKKVASYLEISVIFPCGIVVWISALSHITVIRFSSPYFSLFVISASKGK